MLCVGSQIIRCSSRDKSLELTDVGAQEIDAHCSVFFT